MRNVLSVGFFTQTEEAEYILKVDEHRITGGRRSCRISLGSEFGNGEIIPTIRRYFEAFDNHIMIQKQQELLYRVNDFRFSDWKDLQNDSDVVMGRLLHNRIGYTVKSNLPTILGLKPDPWIGPMEEELLSRVREGENVTRLEIMEHYPKGDEHRQLQRDLKMLFPISKDN